MIDPEKHEIPAGVNVGPSAYRVICPAHGPVFLTEAEYTRQLDLEGLGWVCPICGAHSWWDDDNYNKHLEQQIQSPIITRIDAEKLSERDREVATRLQGILNRIEAIFQDCRHNEIYLGLSHDEWLEEIKGLAGQALEILGGRNA